MIRVRLSGGAFFFRKMNRIVDLTPFLCGVFFFGDEKSHPQNVDDPLKQYSSPDAVVGSPTIFPRVRRH